MANNDVTPNASQATSKEAFFFLNIISCMKNKPDVDWDKVAELSNYTSANSAKTRFAQIKKRLGVSSNGSGFSSASPSSAKKPNGGKVTLNARVTKTTANGRSKKAKVFKVEKSEKNEDELDEKYGVQEDAKGFEHEAEVEEYEDNGMGYYDADEGFDYVDSTVDHHQH